MKECIDIYTRVVIATITFVVPIIINLLSTFSLGEKKHKELSEDFENKLAKKIEEDVQNNPDGIKGTLKANAKLFAQNDKRTNSELSKLNPIRQFWIIFFFLTLSIICLLIYFLTKANKWSMESYFNPTITLIISGLNYCIGLFFIIRILYTITNTKRFIESK